MKRFQFFSLCVLSSVHLAAEGAPITGARWNYQQEGPGGPDNWPGVCHNGRAQSPINIINPEHTILPEMIYAGYDDVLDDIVLTNNGHTVKFSSFKNMPTVTGGGLPGHFIFAQGHLHWGNSSGVGSEHLVGGKGFPLEIHLVHFNSKYVTIGESLKHEDGLAVIGVMHKLSNKDNQNLEPIIESLEFIKNAKDQVDLSRGFSLASLLPSDTSSFYRYSGSLTTPGCNEIVTWTVPHHDQTVSERQLERLRAVLDSDGFPMGDNFRPVMPLNGRRVLVTPGLLDARPYPIAQPLPHPAEYPVPAPTQEYTPDIDQTNIGGYGINKDPYCHKVEKVVFENQCEPYKEKTCYTQNREECQTELYKNCTGVIETDVQRVCFNVNELVCNLVEAIHYETLEETYQVQKCFTGKDRVCDTTYKIDTTTKDDFQCCNVETPNCYMEEKIINDVTCTDTVEFDCRHVKSTKNDGYGQKEVVCSRKPKQDCYNIPRMVSFNINNFRILNHYILRSKLRCVRLMSTGTARSSTIYFPSPWRSRTATLSRRRSVNWR